MIKVNFKYIATILFVLILKYGVVKSQTITVSSFTKEQNKGELIWLQKVNKQFEELKKKQAQNDSIDEVEEVFIIVDEGHTFHGQAPEIGFSKYIEYTIKYPKEALKNEMEGTIVIKFNVNHHGKIEETHILNGISPVLNNEAIRVINSSPNWSAGRARGPFFRNAYILTIDFRLKDKYTSLFRGGVPEIEFRKYIKENLIYPEEALEHKIEGYVLVRFTVTKKGEVTNTHILKGCDYYLNKEAIRVINNSPKWDISASRIKSKDITYVFPVIFKIFQDNKEYII